MSDDFGHINRFEVIDHRSGAGLRLGDFYTARVFQAYGCDIKVSLQDGGQTLKVFVSDAAVSGQEQDIASSGECRWGSECVCNDPIRY